MRRVWLLVCVLLVPISAVSANPMQASYVFEKTAHAPREWAYIIGRDVLLSRGEAVAPIARAHRDDADPGARWLARLLLLRHERPEEAARWSDVLSEATGDLPRDALPVVVDALREGHETRARRAVDFVVRWQAAEIAPFLALHLGRGGRRSTAFEDALVALGSASAAHVRPYLSAAADSSYFGRTGRPAVAPAARVLRRLVDEAAADDLATLVRESDLGSVFRASAQALVAIAPERGAPLVLDRLLARNGLERKPSRSGLFYRDLRQALLAFGPAAARAVEERAGGTDPAQVSILAGLAWELADSVAVRFAYGDVLDEASNVDGLGPTPWTEDDRSAQGRRLFWNPRAEVGSTVPGALLRERAAAYGEVADLVRLLDRGVPAAVGLARVALGARYVRNHGERLVLALAEHDPEAALAVVASALARDPPPHDFDRGYVEALVLLHDHSRAAEMLRTIAALTPDTIPTARHRPLLGAAPIAQAALSVVDGRASWEELLDADETDAASRVPLIVARILARRGNPAGVPRLAAAAVAARPTAYRGLRADLLRAGAAPETDDGETVRMRVLRVALERRLAAPSFAAGVDRAIARHQPHIRSIRGPQPHHFVEAGRQLAAAVGRTARPLLEEAALYERDRVAVHALGALAEDASIPVLLAIAERSPASAAAALRAMGEKGLRAARTIPAPDPDRENYRGRARRHSASAEALVGVEGGIEKILEGLAEAPPPIDEDSRPWARRMVRYLEAALVVDVENERAFDERLLEPALALLEGPGAQHRDIAHRALRVLAHYRDLRVAEAALPFLPRRRRDYDGRAGLAALEASVGGTDEAISFLDERLPTEGESALHSSMLHTLGRLVRRPAATQAARDAYAARLRDALTVPDLASQAAVDLLALHTERPKAERNDADRAAVLAFVAGTADPGVVVHDLVRTKLPGAAEALYAAYRRGRNRTVLHVGLASFGYEPAADVVYAEAARRIAIDPPERWRFNELQDLARLGPSGRRWARTFLGTDHDLPTRLAAASALAVVDDALAYDAMLVLLDDVERLPEERAHEVTRFGGPVFALMRADPKRAHAELVQRALTAVGPWRERYLHALSGLRLRHPELASELPDISDD